MRHGLSIIKVSIALDRRRIIEGHLDDVSPSNHSIFVAILSAKFDVPPPGTYLYLRCEIPGEGPLAQILAVVNKARNKNGKCILDFEVINWHELHRRLPSHLSTDFNRRRHYRVSMPRHNETEVSVLLNNGSTLSATMLDLSAKGSKLYFASDEAPNVGETLRIKFCLPTSEYHLHLLAKVTSQWEVKNGRNCGIEFQDKSPAEDKPFLSQQKLISQYIMERQRELTRMGLKTDSRAPIQGGQIHNIRIDESDSIVYVEDGWIQFAQLNGGAELPKSAVIGTSVWDFISGDDTRNLYRSIFERVRTENSSIKLPYRCDTPGSLCHMELEVSAAGNRGLNLSSRLLRQENYTRKPHPDGAACALSAHNYLMCSLCKRVREDGAWINLEDALDNFHVFEAAAENIIAYSVCEFCQDFVTRYV